MVSFILALLYSILFYLLFTTFVSFSFFFQQEDLENALASVKTALRLNNSNGESFLIASQIYRQMEKYDHLSFSFFSPHPTPPTLPILLACSNYSNRYDMALRALEIGLVCAPANADNVEIRKALEEGVINIKFFVVEDTN